MMTGRELDQAVFPTTTNTVPLLPSGVSSSLSTRPASMSPMDLLAQSSSSKQTPTAESRMVVNATTTRSSSDNTGVAPPPGTTTTTPAGDGDTVKDPEFDLEDWSGEPVPANFTNGSAEFENEMEDMEDEEDDNAVHVVDDQPSTTTSVVGVVGNHTTATSTVIASVPATTPGGLVVAPKNTTTTTTTTMPVTPNTPTTTHNITTTNTNTTIPTSTATVPTTSHITTTTMTTTQPTDAPTEEEPHQGGLPRPEEVEEVFHDGQHPQREDDDDNVVVDAAAVTGPPTAAPIPKLPSNNKNNNGSSGSGSGKNGIDHQQGLSNHNNPGTTVIDTKDDETSCGSLVWHKDVLQCHQHHNPYSFYASMTLFAVILVWFFQRGCRRCCSGGRNSPQDAASRGEYRAVAAQFARSGFDNTFSDELSDDGEGGLVDSDDDDFTLEDPTWNKSGRRVLEMGTFRSNERNGGLSLKEMNG
jgi:hypothetical protein